MRWKLPRPKADRAEAGRIALATTSSRTAGSATSRHCASRHPEPGSAVRGRRPATWPTSRRCTRSRRRSWNCCPGWSSAAVESPCCWRTGNRWRPSSSWCRWGPRAGTGWLARPAMPWRTRCRTVSMNWTRTLGAPALCPGRAEFRPVHADPARLRAAACRGTAFTEFYLRFFGHHLRARWPSPAACSRTRWSRGCAGAGRRGACAWWSIDATGQGKTAAAGRRPSRC